MTVEVEQETDGRWISEIPAIAGAMGYDDSKSKAVVSAQALALRILADRLDHGEAAPELDHIFTIKTRTGIRP